MTYTSSFALVLEARCNFAVGYTGTGQNNLVLSELTPLIDRYRSAGLTSIRHDFYSGGRHEMFHELNSPRCFCKAPRLYFSSAGKPS
jgi:hypothetical protein